MFSDYNMCMRKPFCEYYVHVGFIIDWTIMALLPQTAFMYWATDIAIHLYLMEISIIASVITSFLADIGITLSQTLQYVVRFDSGSQKFLFPEHTQHLSQVQQVFQKLL